MKENLSKNLFFTIVFMFSGITYFSQQKDTNRTYLFIDTITPINFDITILSTNSEFSIHHYCTKKDSITCEKYSWLANTEPSEENHINYYKLAYSLWHIKRNVEAKKCF